MTIFFHSTLPESPEEIPRHVFQRCVVSASWFWKPSEKFGDSSHIRSRVAIYLQLPKCHRGTNYNPDFDLILFSIDECQREVFGLSLEISEEGQWEIRKNGGLFTLQIAFLLISGFEVSPSRVHGSVLYGWHGKTLVPYSPCSPWAQRRNSPPTCHHQLKKYFSRTASSLPALVPLIKGMQINLDKW